MGSNFTYYLEMCSPTSFSPKKDSMGLELTFINPPNPELNRRFYCEVGTLWKWTDRLVWNEENWEEYTCRDSLLTWVGKLNGKEVGYFELESQDNGNIEVVLFGLLPDSIGKGLGAAFLSLCIESAWCIPGAKRVWLHTCTLDHKHALDNYLKRGFKLYKTDSEEDI